MSYKNQHIIPKAYLKYFALDNFVHFLELRNPYRKEVRREGVGHKVFCRTKYYNYKGNPFLEKAFSKVESGTYENIIKRLSTRQNLGYETKQLIIEWILMLKMRNTAFRDNFSGLFSWMKKTHYSLVHRRKTMEQKEAEFDKLGEQQGKAFQLSSFLNQENYLGLHKAFSVNFLNRHWTVLIAKDQNCITSDNPGFSFSFSPHLLRLGLSPLSSIFNLVNNVNSIHCFPLASNMCLLLTPILEGDLPELSEAEMKKFISSCLIN